MAVQQGSPIREALNSAILELQERGLLHALKTKWWSMKNGGGVCRRAPTDFIDDLMSMSL